MLESGSMLRVLAAVEEELPRLIADTYGWSTLYVDYEPPFVERVWRQFGEHRIYLHRILPCDTALFHPHPWPSAVKIIGGRYEMGLGFGAGNDPPPIAATTILTQGASYEMVHPDGWHYVKPLVNPSYSVMVTGRPWGRWSPGPPPGKTLAPLSSERALGVLAVFENTYHTPLSR